MRIYSNPGSETLTGGAGIDTVVYEGFREDYRVQIGNPSRVEALLTNEGTDTLVSIERAKFLDATVALDLEGHAGHVARLIGAVFGAPLVTNREYVGIGLDLLDRGMGLEQLAAYAVSVTGRKTASDICTLLWTNVVRVAPTFADLEPFINALTSGEITVGGLALLAAQTDLNAQNIQLVGLLTTGLAYLPVQAEGSAPDIALF